MISSSQRLTPATPPADTGLPSDATIERLPLPDGGTFELALLAAPAVDAANHDAIAADLVGRAVAWASAAAGDGLPLAVPLYGTHVVWSPRRGVALGPADRLPAMRGALVEFADREAELRDIERRLTGLLEHVDGDAPLAFEFDEAAMSRRQELAGRFREGVSLRRRLALLAPAVHRPAPQPPTLGGQVGERLRDRTRLIERLEHAVEQADLVERVYAGCGERAADFVTSRRHATLEWVIILLLVAEVVLITIDLLAARGS
jgi:hypothetical protein